MLYTNQAENTYFTNGQFNFDILVAITNVDVVQKVKDLLVYPIIKISIEQTDFFTNIALYSFAKDVVFIRYDGDYDKFQLNFIPYYIFEDFHLKII